MRERKTNDINDNQQLMYRWLYEGCVLWDQIIPIQLLKSTKGQRFVVRNTRARCRAIASQTLYNEILSIPRLPHGRLNASHGRDPPIVPPSLPHSSDPVRPLQINGFTIHAAPAQSLKGNHKVFILHYGM